LLGVLDDRAKGSAPEVIARRFHRSLAEQVGAVAVRLGARRVVLSGGCFQNRLLLELAAGELRDAGVEVHRHRRVPPNDGGLALGQLAAAALGPAQES
jgi:hydrogenase maturation protein HypF